MGQGFKTALRYRVKTAQPIKNITKKVKPIGLRRSRRPNVNNPAAQGIIPRLGHSGSLREPHAHQKGAQGVFVYALAHSGVKGRLAQQIARGQKLRGRIERG